MERCGRGVGIVCELRPYPRPSDWTESPSPTGEGLGVILWRTGWSGWQHASWTSGLYQAGGLTVGIHPQRPLRSSRPFHFSAASLVVHRGRDLTTPKSLAWSCLYLYFRSVRMASLLIRSADSPDLNDATVGSIIIKGRADSSIVSWRFSKQDSKTP